MATGSVPGAPGTAARDGARRQEHVTDSACPHCLGAVPASGRGSRIGEHCSRASSAGDRAPPVGVCRRETCLNPGSHEQAAAGHCASVSAAATAKAS